MRVPTIEVNKPRHLPDGEPSKTHAAVLKIINDEALRFGIRVAESLRPETGISQRPPFLEEMEMLQEAIPDLRIPETFSYEKFGRDLWHPIVAKDQTAHRSRRKYLIENQTQLSKFRAWMEAHGNPKDWIMQDYIESPSDSHSTYRVIVDCLGEVYTSQIMYGAPKAMNLKHDLGKSNAKRAHPTSHLEDPTSEHYLGARVIASNRLFLDRGAKVYERRRTVMALIGTSARRYAGDSALVQSLDDTAITDRIDASAQSKSGAGSAVVEGIDPKRHPRWSQYFNDDDMIGGRLTLNPLPTSHPYSPRERGIIHSHGLNEKYPALPSNIAGMASAVGRAVGMDGDTVKELILGVDFIQDRRGNAYLLEVNRRPRMNSVQDYFGGVNSLQRIAAHRWTINRAINNLAMQHGLNDSGEKY